MKACLIFQRRFAPVAHKIAIELKKKHGVDEFCGYVNLRSSFEFLKKQNDIKYTSLILDEDLEIQSRTEKIDWDYLNKFEKEYGLPNLWPYLSIDRIIRYGMCVREYPNDSAPFNHEQMAIILQTISKSIRNFLETEKPDFIFLPAISAIGNKLIYEIAKKKGIKVFVGAETRINQGYILSNDYKNFSWANIFFEKIQSDKDLRNRMQEKLKEAKKYLNDFRNRPKPYLYVMEEFKKSGSRLKGLENLRPDKFIKSISWLFKLTFKHFFIKKIRDYTDEIPFNFFIDKIKRKFRILIGFNDLYDKYNEKENFVYYPLHLEPELAMLALSPHWTDQKNIIKQIAESLPLSYKLYVKEHPAMVGFRTRAYYKEIKKIPNVKLIHPNFDSYKIINDSKAIYTISGTVGWEGLILKKPIITFGDVFYNALSNVKKIKEIDKIGELTKWALEDHKHDEIELENFVLALMEDSREIKLHEIWEKGVDPKIEHEKIAEFCDLLMKKVKTS
jgi:hypothetical protein